MSSSSVSFWPSPGEMFLSMPDAGYIVTNAHQYNSGYELYYPYLCRLTSDFDTLWTRDLGFIGNPDLQRAPVSTLLYAPDSLLLLTEVYLIEGSFLNGTHGYGLTLLNEQGELLSDTIRWMSDDYHYHLDRFLKLNDDELLMCGALFYNEYDGYILK